MRTSFLGSTIPCLAVAASLLALGACAHGPARPQTPAAAGAAAGAAAAPPAASVAATVEPPDGKWLTDELGRQYFLMDLGNVPGTYKWAGEDRKKVQVAYGLTFDVAEYDDTIIRVKVYKVEARPTRTQHERPREEVAADYAVTTRPVDRLGLQSFDEGLPRSAQWRQGFSIADIDGDGQLDIVSGPARKTGSRPAIFLGDGAGHWRSWRAATYPPIPFDYGDAAAGDLNGDGKADLVIASHLKGISALVQDGSGHFRPWTTGIEFTAGGDPTTGALAFSSRAVKIVDWNGDRRPDIVALGEGPHLLAGRDTKVASGARGLVVYLNNGDGTWQKTDRSLGGSRFYGDDLAVVDVDADGRLDALVGSSVQGFKGVLQRGLPDGSWESQELDPVRGNATIRGVAAGDVDRNGRVDLVLGYQSFEGDVWRTGVDLLLGQPDGTWRRLALASEESMDGIYAMALGDLDGDGALDVVALTGGGEGWILLGDGNGGFVREQGKEIAEPGCRGYHVELPDLDRDGKAEVVAEFAGEGQGLLPQQSAGCASGGSLRAWKVVARNGRGG